MHTQHGGPCMPSCMPNRNTTTRTLINRASYRPVQTTPGHQIQIKSPRSKDLGLFCESMLVQRLQPRWQVFLGEARVQRQQFFIRGFAFTRFTQAHNRLQLLLQ